MPRTEALPLVINLQAAVFRPHQQLDLPITPPVFSPCHGIYCKSFRQLIYLFPNCKPCRVDWPWTILLAMILVSLGINPSLNCTIAYNCGDNTRD